MAKKVLVTALGLATFAGTAQAALEAVDPGPYTAATGFFAQWYRDTDGLTLDLCLSKAVSSRVPGAPGAPSYMCTLLPNPGVFDDALPIVFPTNWPDEAFWFTADANVVAQGVDLIYIAALEAAFGAGLPAPGDQVSFARIRIRGDITVQLNSPGTYRVTHPYGVEIFTVPVPGRRVINFTRDIGIGAPGDFTGALGGDIGPFLRGVGGPYVEINPETAQPETYIGDPNLLEQVTGSPFGTNFVRIERTDVPGGLDASTDLFAISGRVFNNRVPTAVTVDRASYSRTVDPVTGAVTTTIDAFATSSPTAQVCFRETPDLVVGGTDPDPACLITMTPDGTGKFFARDPAAPAVPPFIVVTAKDADTAPTSIAQPLGDVLKATRVEYAKGSKTLLIEATSSDQAVTPKITAVGVGVLATPASCTTFTGQRLKTVLPAEPPAFVTLVSSGGGRHTEPVKVVAAAAANQNPVAVGDSASTLEGAAVTIPVLTNDTDADCDTLTVSAVTQPANGTATTNGTTVTYTPNANFSGSDSFSYSISDGNDGTASASVTVAVAAVNNAPVASPDGPFTTAEDTALTLTHAQLLANDTDVDDAQSTLTVAGFTTQGLAGTFVDNGLSVTFTPNANFSGTTSFTYRAQDPSGALSNSATVTITVTPVNDAPVIISTPVTTGSVGQQYLYDVNANDVDGDALTYSLTQAPPGMSINAATGLISWTPTAGGVGLNPVTVQVTDGLLSATQSFTVTVAAAPAAGVDLDIDRLTVPGQVRRPATVTPSLRVRNNGTVNQPRDARIVGVTAAGAVFYDETVAVSDAPGGGTTTFNFPASQSTTVAGPGTITWTATIADDDPDNDTATATTNVR